MIKIFTRPAALIATKSLLDQGLNLQEIAEKLFVTFDTTVKYVEILFLQGEDLDIERFVYPDKIQHIIEAFNDLGIERLRPVKESLGDNFSYTDLHLVRAKYFSSSLVYNGDKLLFVKVVSDTGHIFIGTSHAGKMISYNLLDQDEVLQ